MNGKKTLKNASLVIAIVISIILGLQIAMSLPVGPTITYVKNETSLSSGTGTARSNDQGGYITTLLLNATQQNYAWKAYVGNVTGVLVLEDSDNYSIFEWTAPALDREVYITRNTSINWSGGLECATTSEIATEDTDMNMGTGSDNINRTFNNGSAAPHTSFTVSGTPVSNSTCPAIATYKNDAAQAASESADFQEVLLADDSGKIVYAALIESDVLGFDNSLYDFQAIVAEDETAGSPTTYYFYVELA